VGDDAYVTAAYSSDASRSLIAAPEMLAARFQSSRFIVPGPARGIPVAVSDEEGRPLLRLLGFAAVGGIVSFFVAATVIVASLAATIFLLSDGRFLSALVALALSGGFLVAIWRLLSHLEVPVFGDDSLERRVVTLTQISQLTFPGTKFLVSDSSGREIGKLRFSGWSRIGRHRWTLLDAQDRHIATATEDSWGRAMLRKLLGKFRPEFETNLEIRSDDKVIGTITRRKEEGTNRGLVDVSADQNDIVDRRLAAALAILVFGLEP
jgi:hypothetical protein